MQSPEFINLSLIDILQIIFKRKFLIMLLFLGTISVVTVGTFLIKPTYEAKAQIMVKLGRESVYVPEIGSGKPLISFTRQMQINSEIEILKSTYLSQEVINSLGPTTIYPELGKPQSGILAYILQRAQKPQDPATTALLILKSNLEILPIKDSDIIEVRFKHTDAQTAATVLNALMKFFLERHLSVNKASQSPVFFRQQVKYLKDQLSRKEADLQALKTKHDITFLVDQQRLLLTKITDMRSELESISSQIVETQTRIAQLRQQLSKTQQIISQGEDINHDTMLINTLEAQLVGLELRKKELLAKYTNDSRLVQNVNEEIEIVNQKLLEQKAESSGVSHWGINPTYQVLQQELHSSEVDLKSLEAKRNIRSTQLQESYQDLERLNSVEKELNTLQQEVEVDRQNYNLYLGKLEESRISEAMDDEKIASVALIEPVQVPIKPVSPKIFFNLVLGLFFGVVGSIGLVFFLHYLDNSLETIDSVENCLEVPVLVSIPYIKMRETLS